MSTKLMVLGFMFNPSADVVILIQKDHPAWQAGKLNGIGGHLKPDETPHQAMVREFKEETGIGTDKTNWSKFCTLIGHDFEVYCFCGKGQHIPTLQPDETEEPGRYMLSNLVVLDQIENLPWLIALAIDHMDDGRPSHAVVTYPLVNGNNG